MGFDTSLDPMKNRSQIQLRFEVTEDGVDFRELNVLAPELFGIETALRGWRLACVLAGRCGWIKKPESDQGGNRHPGSVRG